MLTGVHPCCQPFRNETKLVPLFSFMMMLTGAGDIDMYVDGGDMLWRAPNQNSQLVGNTVH